MANTGFKGIDVRQTSAALVFRASLKNTSGARLSTGTTTLSLYEVQSDGTLKSYDFTSNTFKTTALTTETVSATHQLGNNGTTSTGVWTYSLATLTGFTVNGVYLVVFSNALASPPQQEREFQFGGVQGDLSIDANGNQNVSLASILGTALTESGAGRLTAAVKKFFDVVTPTSTLNQITLVDTATTVTGGATSANQTTILNAVNGITSVTARSNAKVPSFMPRPSSGATVYVADLYLYNLAGMVEDADTNTITVHARNSAGTSRDSGLTSTTMTRVLAGQYRLTYTVNSTDTAEAVYFDFSWTIAAQANRDGGVTEVQDAENYAALAAILNDTTNIKTRIPAALTVDGNIKADIQKVLGAIPSNGVDVTLSSADKLAIAADVWNTLFSSLVTSGTIGYTLANFILDMYEKIGNPSNDSLTSDIAELLIYLRSDRIIDITGVPWKAVYYREGSPTPLYEKRLQTVDGTDVSSTDQIPARALL